jgi:hypothetical protein
LGELFLFGFGLLQGFSQCVGGLSLCGLCGLRSLFPGELLGFKRSALFFEGGSFGGEFLFGFLLGQGRFAGCEFAFFLFQVSLSGGRGDSVARRKR